MWQPQDVHPMLGGCWASIVTVSQNLSNIGCPYCVLSAIEKQCIPVYEIDQVIIIKINNGL